MKNGLTLRLDTGKNGIESVFKPWQNETVNLLLEAHEEHSSAEMLFRLTKRDIKISRASVINFLDALSIAGLAEKREHSSKGGYKGIYRIAETREEFNEKIVKIFCLKMHEAFPDMSWLKTIWEDL